MSAYKIRLAEEPKRYDITGVNTEYGFAHIVTSDELTIQCCLKQRKDENGHKKEISKSDCGENDGICSDINEKAFKKYGKEKCMAFLFSEMRKLGVKIVA